MPAWIHRNVILPIVWSVVGIALVAAPFVLASVPGSESRSAECRHAIISLWAIGGGIIGGLLNLGRLRMASRLVENRVARGIQIEPLVGAGVALIAYLVLLTRQVSIFPVGTLDGEPTFERVLLLGILSGFLWEPLLTRVQALAAQKKLEELQQCKAKKEEKPQSCTEPKDS